MSVAGLLTYAVALLLACAAPGPANVAVLSRALSGGMARASAVVFGIVLGDAILVALALLGLAALASTYAPVLLVLKYAGAAYLIWLGIRMWRRAVGPERGPRGRGLGRDVIVGAVVALSNPKAVLFHASLMPILIDLRELDGPTAVAILFVAATMNGLVMAGYAIVGAVGRARITKGSGGTILNRIAGGAMVGTGVVIATR